MNSYSVTLHKPAKPVVTGHLHQRAYTLYMDFQDKALLCSQECCFYHQPLETNLLESDGPAQMYRLVLAGDAGSGKSSFLLRLSLNEFKGDIPTTLGKC